MKKAVLYFVVAAMVVFTASSCKKSFLDINENPNSPTDASITADLILPRALHATAARVATGFNYSAHWLGYWSRSGTYGPNTEDESYNITTTFQAGQWSGWYNILYDLDIMEKKAAAADQTFYVGIAKALKSIGFMYMVDQYDNVPYSTAFDLAGNIQPAYDKGADIYADLLLQLDEAAKLIKDADVAANPRLGVADIMFEGDADMWRKFINTLRLRLILRQSQVTGFNASAEIAKITADGSGFLGSGETAEVQPGYAVDNGKQNPFWDNFELTYTGDVADQYNRANNFVLNSYRNNNDIRYQYFFDEAASPINNQLYYGYNYGEVIPNSDPKAANSSGVGGPGLARSATQPQWVLTSVESMFLQAEAIQRGWLTDGVPPAKEAYEAAVTESFKWLGVDDAETEAADYLAQSGTLMNWDAAPDKIKLIATQQYLALTGIANFEAYANYRRLGVPAVPLSLSPSRGTNVIPLRLRYPQNEYNYNASNVGKENNPNPQTAGVFWDK